MVLYSYLVEYHSNCISVFILLSFFTKCGEIALSFFPGEWEGERKQSKVKSKRGTSSHIPENCLTLADSGSQSSCIDKRECVSNLRYLLYFNDKSSEPMILAVISTQLLAIA